MARDGLAKLYNQRLWFSGEFMRYGEKPGRGCWSDPDKCKTVLLRNIRTEAGELVTEHLWFNYTEGFAALVLVEGDKVRFKARVQLYQKGYRAQHHE